MGYKVIHDVDVLIDKNKFLEKIGLRGQDIGDFHQIFKDKYGINIGYTTLTNLLDNVTTWKLTYAWFIAKELDVSMDELFFEVSNKDS